MRMVCFRTECTTTELVADRAKKAVLLLRYMNSGNMEYVHLTPEEAERLFRRAFGGFSLDEIFRSAFEHNASIGRSFASPVWPAASPSGRTNRARTEYLTEADILAILRDTLGKCGSAQLDLLRHRALCISYICKDSCKCDMFRGSVRDSNRLRSSRWQSDRENYRFEEDTMGWT